jgi:peptidoglycan/xylan/chitin deacetylase (PgdA/CDA1 family)
MAKLKLLNSVIQWETQQVSEYPEIESFIKALKDIIEKNPEGGLYDPILLNNRKIFPCRKRSVDIFLFFNRYAFGYSRITAHYLYNDKMIVIIKMKYT